MKLIENMNSELVKPHKNVKIKLNDNMLPHYYRIARKLQAQCLLSHGESGGKLSPD